uniref:Aryl hydrocarbon receptor n=1 Tax=Mesocestoides corti TaxID=53468 RepID=A0A5K3EVR4_MESCO
MHTHSDYLQQHPHLMSQLLPDAQQAHCPLMPVHHHQDPTVFFPLPTDAYLPSVNATGQQPSPSTNTSPLSPRMKERSKNAARSRRVKENVEFANLASLLPMSASITSQLDKASIIRLATSYLKVRAIYPNGVGYVLGRRQLATTMPSSVDENVGVGLLTAMDGFLFIISPDCKFLYISETVSPMLGLQQVDMIGNDISEYLHSADIEDIKQVLAIQPTEIPPTAVVGEEFNLERRFVVRMNGYLKFRVIHADGYTQLQNLGLIASGFALPIANINSTEVRLGGDMFMFRASLDLRLIYLEGRVSALTGYQPQDLIEKTIYQLVHASDAEELRRSHEILIKKGQVTTGYYRLLTKNGGWVWIQTYATKVHNSRSSRPNCIIGLNYVLTSTDAADLKIQENHVMTSLQNPSTESFTPAALTRSRQSEYLNSFSMNQNCPADLPEFSPTASAYPNPAYYFQYKQPHDVNIENAWFCHPQQSSPHNQHIDPAGCFFTSESGPFHQQTIGGLLQPLSVGAVDDNATSSSPSNSSQMSSTTATTVRQGFLEQPPSHPSMGFHGSWTVNRPTYHWPQSE